MLQPKCAPADVARANGGPDLRRPVSGNEDQGHASLGEAHAHYSIIDILSTQGCTLGASPKKKAPPSGVVRGT